MDTSVPKINILEQIKQLYGESKYVFKKCMNIEEDENKVWFVVLSKLKQTKTNEDRKSVVDTKCAMYRANKLKVIDILNVNDFELKRKKIVNAFLDVHIGYSYAIYEVGKIVRANSFDNDIGNVSSCGIHYYKSIDLAYFHLRIPEKYEGVAFCCDINGAMLWKAFYLNGLKNGFWIKWSADGFKTNIADFLNGEYNGNFVAFHTNGNKKEDGLYINGKKESDWTNYDNNGDIMYVDKYRDGELRYEVLRY